MTRYATPGLVVNMIMVLVGMTTAGEGDEPFDGLHGFKGVTPASAVGTAAMTSM